MGKPGPKGAWDIIKSMSVTEIAREANRPLSVAVVGPESVRAEAMRALFQPDVQEQLALPAPSAVPEPAFVQGYDALTEDAKFPNQTGVYDFVIDVGNTDRGNLPAGLTVYSVADLGGWDAMLDRILEDKPNLVMALARNFPVFRRRAAQKIIHDTATANAQFSLVTGVAEAFPILREIGFPGVVLSDVFVLTKNQTLMTLRLAAAYGLPLDYKSRLKEVAPILANAFGWRAVARELVGLIPVVGFLAKPAIAYAGTATVGKAAQLYYETGEQVTSAQARRIYKEAYEVGKTRVRELASGMRRGKGGGSKRIPAHATLQLEDEAAPVTEELEIAPTEEAMPIPAVSE